MKDKLSSRERMLLALENKLSDYPPCNFMIFTALRKKCKSRLEFIKKQQELGLDTRVHLPELPFRFHPQVEVRQWKEEKGGQIPLLYKEYLTPKGKLTSIVKKGEDWPYGDEVPLFNDFLIPRSSKFLISKTEDLESLAFLFPAPTPEDISTFREEARMLKQHAQENGLLVSAGWESTGNKGINKDGGCMGMDGVMWLCGMENTLLLALNEPEIIKGVMQIIHEWNKKRMEIYLEEGVDLLLRRGWYESTDLWSPSLYREFIFPFLKEEIELTHQQGTKFGYIMTSGVMPLVEDLRKLNLDTLIGADPIQDQTMNLELLKEKLGEKTCLWGGVNGSLTIEQGKKEEVEKAVEQALSILAPGGGFILSPVDNVTEDTSLSWANVKTLIETWREKRVLYTTDVFE